MITTEEDWKHKAMVAQLESSSRSAAADQMRKEIDVLEEGLAQARREIKRLRAIMEFRHGAGTAQEDPGE